MRQAKKPKPLKQTLEDLLKTSQVITGKTMVEKRKLMDEAIEFEIRQRAHRIKSK